MLYQNLLISHSVSTILRTAGPVVDVYRIVAQLQVEFPGTPTETLRDIVNEEIVRAGLNAVWQKPGV
jgi:hypothetical protein